MNDKHPLLPALLEHAHAALAVRFNNVKKTFSQLPYKQFSKRKVHVMADVDVRFNDKVYTLWVGVYYSKGAHVRYFAINGTELVYNF